MKNERWEVRRQEAEERNREWEGLTPKEKVEKLDQRLGKGMGAKRQREKLARAL
jgi:hypothetical protein